MRLNLLTTNSKLEKSIALFGDDIVTAGLALAPHRHAGLKGVSVCKSATPGCILVCNLWYSGRIVTEPVRNAMRRRTRELFDNPASFHARLENDLDRITRYAERHCKTAYVRLNVASDLDWVETIKSFPSIQFYDYTKVKTRSDKMAKGLLPENYWITPSYSERMHAATFAAYLRAGLNVSVVFDTEYRPQHDRIGELPKTFRGFPVIDGDKHDLRHADYDGVGNVVGLRFKGSRKTMAKAIQLGFVIAT